MKPIDPALSSILIISRTVYNFVHTNWYDLHFVSSYVVFKIYHNTVHTLWQPLKRMYCSREQPSDSISSPSSVISLHHDKLTDSNKWQPSLLAHNKLSLILHYAHQLHFPDESAFISNFPSRFIQNSWILTSLYIPKLVKCCIKK